MCLTFSRNYFWLEGVWWFCFSSFFLSAFSIMNLCFCYKQKKSRKIKLDHPRWPNFVVEMAPVCSAGRAWIGTVLPGKKITLIDKCSNELYALRFQIPTYGIFSFVPAYHSLETKSSVQWRCSFVALSLLMNTVSKLHVQQLVNSFGDYGASTQRGIMVPLKW